MRTSVSNIPSFFKRNVTLSDSTTSYLWALVGPSIDPRVWHRLAKMPLSDVSAACERAWSWFIRDYGTEPAELQLSGKNHEVGDVKAIRQLLRFPMKLRVSSANRKEEALKAFISVEDEIKSFAPDEELLTELREIVTGWFRRIGLDDLPFGHGPGSVSEGNLPLADKYLAIGVDDLITYTYGDNSYRPGNKVIRKSRVVVVPKTVLKDRTICAEPATLMFYQKGVQRRLYEYISAHPYLGKRIPLRDQSRNGELALKSSASAWRWNGPWDTYTCSTIDLSAASDRLSWHVVRSLFKGTPLLRHLWATRSRVAVLPDGQEVNLAKFAAMGSALCFPIQSIVYAACCEKAARTEKREFATWSVFGDDIICHASIHDRVCDYLTKLGLKINVDKSFSGTHPFRESCGVEAYNGEDVTPVTFAGCDRSSEGIMATLAKAGELVSRGDTAAAYFLYYWVHDNLPRALRPFLEVGPGAAFEFPFDVFTCRHKWSKAYQRARRPMITAKVKDQTIPDDELRYFHQLLMYRQRGTPWHGYVKYPDSSSYGNYYIGYTFDGELILATCGEAPPEPYSDKACLGPLTVIWSPTSPVGTKRS